MKMEKQIVPTAVLGIFVAIANVVIGKLQGVLFWFVTSSILLLSLCALWVLAPWYRDLLDSKKQRILGFRLSTVVSVLIGILIFSVITGVGMIIVNDLRSHGRCVLQILDANGKPMPGLDVNIYQMERHNHVGFGRVTDATGSVPIFLVPEGPYNVSVFRKVGTNEMELMEATLEINASGNTIRWPFAPKRVKVIVFPCSLFEMGQSELIPFYKEPMRDVASWIAINQGRLFIHGHCDDTGTDTWNDRLGFNRVEAVVDTLMHFGVERKRLFCFSYGRHKLAYPGFPFANEKNRRVELYLLPQFTR